MDEAEAHIKKYLEHRGFKAVVHEPDGNIPPDFLADGRIAIEVRRLIQHEDTGGTPRGLTETQIPLFRRIQSLLESMGPPNRAASWFVFVRFARPLEDWSTLRPRIEAWLKAFKDGPQTSRADMDFGHGFSLTIASALNASAQLFLLGMFSDWDSGGWVLAELERNLRICIAEKTKKIALVRAKYPEWWLVLSDHIGLALSKEDRQQFRSTVTLSHTWDKIILVNPADHTSAFEI